MRTEKFTGHDVGVDLQHMLSVLKYNPAVAGGAAYLSSCDGLSTLKLSDTCCGDQLLLYKSIADTMLL